MMKIKLALLAAAGSLALASAAHAGEGYYGALGAGISFGGNDNDFEDTGSAFPASFTTDYDLDDNIAVRAAFGKYFGNHRVELEFSHRNHDIAALPGDGLGFAGFPNVNGDTTMQALMVNAYHDFDFGSFDPYLGLGVGFARFRPVFNNLEVSPAAVATDPYKVVVSDQDWALAGQAVAGVTYALQDNLDLDVSYRYLQTAEFKYGGYVNDIFTNLDTEVTEQEIYAGLRWNFGAAPVAPVPVAPAPAPVQYRDCADGSRVMVSEDCPTAIVEEVMAPSDLDLTVYFDYDKSNLTAAAQSLISAKSSEAQQYDISSVVVEGNTDTAGSAAYNNALSARRAAVVRDALTANGIDGGIISVQALGESNPAKATQDGVREPLNRRTEVTFNF
jgi:OmpA-OmpF porin, OOP family